MHIISFLILVVIFAIIFVVLVVLGRRQTPRNSDPTRSSSNTGDITPFQDVSSGPSYTDSHAEGPAVHHGIFAAHDAGGHSGHSAEHSGYAGHDSGVIVGEPGHGADFAGAGFSGIDGGFSDGGGDSGGDGGGGD